MRTRRKMFCVAVVVLLAGFAWSQNDTIPPEVTWSAPADGETLYIDGGNWCCGATSPDQTYGVEIFDNSPTDGINSSSFEITFQECGASWSTLSDYQSFFGWEYGSASDSFNSLGLEYGKCYQLCAHIYDNQSNLGGGCVTFYTPPPPPLPDTCSPFISEWHPASGETLCPPDGDIWFTITDPENGFCSCSGIGHVEATLHNYGNNFYLLEAQGLYRVVIDSCIVRFMLDPAYYSLMGGTSALLEVYAYDGAGRNVSNDVEFFVCAPQDTCPPIVFWSSPNEGETLFYDNGSWWRNYGANPDSTWNVNFEEFGCPGTGLDSSSFSMSIQECGSITSTSVEYYGGYFSWDYGNAWGSLNSLGLQPGQCYELCAEIDDNEGNHGGGCVTFYTASDTCPPGVSYMEPFPGGMGIDPLAYVRAAYLYDPEDSVCMYSGVDSSTITMMVIINGDTFDVTGEMTYNYGDVWWYHPGNPFPPGADVVACVNFADYAGNWAHECTHFKVTTKVDTCPPNVFWSKPSDGDTLYFSGNSWWRNYYGANPDSMWNVNFEEFECPGTGLDSSSFEVSMREYGGAWKNILHYDAYFGWDYGNASGSLNKLRLLPGKCYELCAEINDRMGNNGSDCIIFYTAPSGDTCSPYVDHWFPPNDSCIPVEANPGVKVCEDVNCDPTGINLDATIVTLSFWDGPFEDITGDCYFDPAGDCVYIVRQSGTGGVSLLPPGTEVTMCIHVEDYVGNVLEDCNTWMTCGESPDSCPPIVLNWANLVMDTICPPDELISLHISDSIYGCGPCSGIYEGSLIVTINNAGMQWSLYPYDGLIVDPMGNCDLYVGLDTAAYNLEPGTIGTLCVEVYDNSGNRLEDRMFFYVCDTTVEPDDCPPYVLEWHPDDGDTLCPPNEDVWFRVIDPLSDVICPTCSLDRSSLIIHLHNNGQMYEMFDGGGLIFTNEGNCELDVILDDAYYVLAPGTGATLCVVGADGAGNQFDSCIAFWICDTMPIDTCPPLFVEWLPDSCLLVNGGFVVRIDDPFNTAECSTATGVDRQFFSVALIIHPDTLDITGECQTAGWGLYGMEIEWHTVGWNLPYDADVTVCVEVHDHAGNAAEECHNYHTCPEALQDTCPPMVGYIEPFPGAAEVDTLAYIRAAYLYDPQGPGCIYSGVDSSTISMIVIINDDTLDITDELEGLGGYDLWWYHPDNPFPPGAHVEACIDFADFAGNWTHECTYFDVMGGVQQDTCPPVIEWSSPGGGDTLFYDGGIWRVDLGTHLDSSFMVNFHEFECPGTGLDSSSFEITFRLCGSDTWQPVAGYEAYFGPDYGNAWGSFGLLELEPEQCYEICAEIDDSAGNHTGECIIFYTAEIPDSVDHCPPVVVSWFPEVDTCLPPTTSGLGVVLMDPLDDNCPVATGVDTSSIVVILHIGADTFDVTGECQINVAGDYVTIEWYSMTEFPEGVTIALCVSASDHAENSMRVCYDWQVCSDEEDECPPVVELEHPDTSECLPPDSGMIYVFVLDPQDSFCPVASGVDSSTISVTVAIAGNPVEDVTDECDIFTSYSGYGISWQYSDLPEGETVMLCVDAADIDGNWINPPVCFTWTTCEAPDTTDDCPPEVQWISIYDSSLGVPIDAHIAFDLWDPHGIGTPCSVCTGIDTQSVVLTIISDDTMVFVLSDSLMLMYWTAGACDLAAWLDPSFMLEPETEYIMCIDAADNAGNEMETYCVLFTTEEESLVDVWSPCIVEINPLHNTVVEGPDVSVMVQICDICEGTEFATGVDSATIRMTINGSYVTNELAFEPLDCYGWALFWDGTLPENEHHVCVWGRDRAGNYFDSCWAFAVVHPETTVNVEIIEPMPQTRTACDDQQIIAYFINGIGSVPDTFEFIVDGEAYTLISNEVSVSGDTMTFTPSEPWTEGIVHYHIGTAYGLFGVDLSPPDIELTFPECDDTLFTEPPFIAVRFSDYLSGIDMSSMVVTIAAQAFTVDSPGVYLHDTLGALTMVIVPDEVGLVLEGEIEVCGMAGDSPDYCSPNNDVNCCNFWVIPPPTYIVAGYVEDTIIGFPLGGIIIAAFNRMGSPWPRHTATGPNGFYSLELTGGKWVLGAFDPEFGYPPVFWDGHPFPFDADPIFLSDTVSDTVWANFGMGVPSDGVCKATGTVQESGSSTPIAGAVVVAIATDDDDEELSVSSDVTDSSGNFSMPILNGKNYYLMAFADECCPSFHGGDWDWNTADSIMITGDTTGLELSLESQVPDTGDYDVFGTVYEQVGGETEFAEFPGVMVCLCGVAAGEPMYCDYSDYDGSYSIGGVESGVYRLKADRTFYVPLNAWGTIDASDGVARDIYLKHRNTGVDEFNVPNQMMLFDARPNPFNASTALEFYIPNGGYATLEIMDIAGRSVVTLLDQNISEGYYVAVWNAENIPSGVYFARLRLGGVVACQKLMLAK